ncbi:MAG: hypothetical protein IJP68_12235 [Selenomonadaceae bacterium]|nr:hypothetical protein [Selenomonadaceae bacterium]
MKKIFMTIMLFMLINCSAASAQDVWIDSGTRSDGTIVDTYIMTETFSENHHGDFVQMAFEITLKGVNRSTGQEIRYQKNRPRMIYYFFFDKNNEWKCAVGGGLIQPLSNYPLAPKILDYCKENLFTR